MQAMKKLRDKLVDDYIRQYEDVSKAERIIAGLAGGVATFVFVPLSVFLIANLDGSFDQFALTSISVFIAISSVVFMLRAFKVRVVSSALVLRLLPWLIAVWGVFLGGFGAYIAWRSGNLDDMADAMKVGVPMILAPWLFHYARRRKAIGTES